MKNKTEIKFVLWLVASCILAAGLAVCGMLTLQGWIKYILLIAIAVIGVAVDVMLVVMSGKLINGHKAIKKLNNYVAWLVGLLVVANLGSVIVSLLAITTSVQICVLICLAVVRIAVCVLIYQIIRAMLNQLENIKQQQTQKTASAPSGLDIFALLGIPPQYNKDGSLKTMYQLVGITPQYDDKGKRILTIYETLGINPLFKANGKEVPFVLRIKNRARAVAKPQKATIPLYFKPRPRVTQKDAAHGPVVLPPTAAVDKSAKVETKKQTPPSNAKKPAAAKKPAVPVFGSKNAPVGGGKPGAGKVTARTSKTVAGSFAGKIAWERGAKSSSTDLSSGLGNKPPIDKTNIAASTIKQTPVAPKNLNSADAIGVKPNQQRPNSGGATQYSASNEKPETPPTPINPSNQSSFNRPGIGRVQELNALHPMASPRAINLGSKAPKLPNVPQQPGREM